MRTLWNAAGVATLFALGFGAILWMANAPKSPFVHGFAPTVEWIEPEESALDKHLTTFPVVQADMLAIVRSARSGAETVKTDCQACTDEVTLADRGQGAIIRATIRQVVADAASQPVILPQDPTLRPKRRPASLVKK